MINPPLELIRTHILIAVLVSVGLFSLGLANEPKNNFVAGVSAVAAPSDSQNVEVLDSLQQQARLYRADGFRLQQQGRWEEALSCYQKAVETDPAYALAQNDLGVAFEALGEPDRAQECYLTALDIDPRLGQAYTNLAMLSENNRDFKQAALYWKRRYELGPPESPWTYKAKKRYNDIRLSLSDPQDLEEKEVLRLTDSVIRRKALEASSPHTLAEGYFEFAKQKYKQNDYAKAMKYATDALLLDSSNKEISAFIEKLQTQVLSK